MRRLTRPIIRIFAILFTATTIIASPVASLNSFLPITRTNSTNPPRPPDPQCVDSHNWVTSSFLGGDCYTAIDKFYNRESLVWGTTFLDFFAYRYNPSQPSIWAQRTPKKYKYKSCTMAIVMLADLPRGVVPAGQYLGHDWTSYRLLEAAVKEVLARCISPVLGDGGRGRGRGGGVRFTNPTGYAIAGRDQSIGVFLWDTDSLLNRIVPLAQSTPKDWDLLPLAGMVNSTASGAHNDTNSS